MVMGNSNPILLQARCWRTAWDATQTLALANEVSDMLQSEDGPHWLQQMYGNQPDHWSDGLQGMARWRVIVNALTRLRFCTADGVMEFAAKEGAKANRARVDKDDAGGVAELRKRGMTVIENVDKAKFIATMAPVNAEFEKRFGKANLDRIRNFK